MANYDTDIVKYDSEYDSFKLFRYEKSNLATFHWFYFRKITSICYGILMLADFATDVTSCTGIWCKIFGIWGCYCRLFLSLCLLLCFTICAHISILHCADYDMQVWTKKLVTLRTGLASTFRCIFYSQLIIFFVQGLWRRDMQFFLHYLPGFDTYGFIQAINCSIDTLWILKSRLQILVWWFSCLLSHNR